MELSQRIIRKFKKVIPYPIKYLLPTILKNKKTRRGRTIYTENKKLYFYPFSLFKREVFEFDLQKMKFLGIYTKKFLQTENVIFLIARYNNEKIIFRFRPILEMADFIGELYNYFPNTAPDYAKGLKFIFYLSTDKGILNFFDKKIFLTTVTEDKEIQILDEFNTSDITDFDYFITGTFRENLLLEVNYEVHHFKIISPQYNIIDFHFFVDLFSKLNPKLKNPYYLDADERYIIESGGEFDSALPELRGNYFLLLTDKNFYLLKYDIDLTGKRVVKKKIPLSEIESGNFYESTSKETSYYVLKLELKNKEHLIFRYISKELGSETIKLLIKNKQKEAENSNANK